jgi:hypothetical protein
MIRLWPAVILWKSLCAAQNTLTAPQLSFMPAGVEFGSAKKSPTAKQTCYYPNAKCDQ